MNNQYFYSLPNITTTEIHFLQQINQGLDEEGQRKFMMFYSGKRRDPQHILLFTLLGFLGVAGVQRFATNQMGMGIVYIFTAGLCFIGTIIDTINYKSIADEYNHKMAIESRQFMEMVR